MPGLWTCLRAFLAVEHALAAVGVHAAADGYVQGELHWRKFNALLSGLPEGTKLMEVIKIRKWKPQKGDSAEYKEEMRRLQKDYALPNEIIGEEEEYEEEF